MPWRRGIFCLAVMLFLLIFAGGAERLIGRPEKQPDTPRMVMETVLAPPAIQDAGQLFIRTFRSSFERGDEEADLPVLFVLPEIRTDANGTVIAGRRSYLHLRYQAFSLSDGFV